MTTNRQGILVAIAMAFLLGGCGNDYDHEATESDRFNVYFYYPRSDNAPSEGEVYLGEATGISACQRAAGNFASSKNMTSRTGWSYVCCRIAHGSGCYTKHR